MSKIVVYCGTRNIYHVMIVAAKSLLNSTPVDAVYFLTEDNEFPDPVPPIIHNICVANQNWFPPDGVNMKSSWPYMAFVRLALAKILPSHDRVLYLDTDTIVLQDISPIFSMDLTGKVFGMIREDDAEIPLEICKAFSDCGSQILLFQSDNPRPEYCTHPYFNSGVMLMNLAELRKTGIDDRIIHEINTVSYPYPDQDAINLLCNGRIAQLPLAYNVIRALHPDFPQEMIKIKHFASEKPLWKSSLWQSYKRLSWDNVMARQEQLRQEVST